MKPLQLLRYLEKRATAPLVTLCLYEAFALTFPNKKTPPITVLARDHWWFLPTFFILLNIHVHCYQVNEVVDV